jgi:hypothetical protein
MPFRLPWFDPDRCHGRRRRRGFFEGWYYKLVGASGARTLAVIPGLFLSRDGRNRFGFVMTVDGSRVALTRYPMADVEARSDRFDLRIGANRFSAGELSLDLDAGGIPWRGTLSFTDRAPWPVTWTSPGAMGWYAYMPFMECFHGVVSLDHRIDGALDVGQARIDLAGGRGYTEKDWGRNFPSSWVWMQANHFEVPGVSLFASVAIIPFLGTTFGGSIVGLQLDGQLYRFATYTGARVRALDVEPARVRVVVEDRRHRLEMEASRGPTVRLFGPTADDMVPRVDECLASPIAVRLSLLGGPVLFEGRSPIGALEAQGDVARLRRLLELA